MADMLLHDDNYDIMASIRSEIQREIPTLSRLKEELRDEVIDPEIKMFRNFRHLSVEQLDTFNFDTGMFDIPPYDKEGEDPAMTTKWNVHAPRSYHYKIGQFETSP